MCFVGRSAGTLKRFVFAPCAFVRVQIQMLLHFLLLSLPGKGTAPSHEDARAAIADALPLPPSLSPTKSKKRKHKDRGIGRAPDLPPQPLEERLESYMDKLAMWQLMQSVDSSLHRRGGEMSTSAVGKEKLKDERDWMQVFCEDTVEPLFVSDICSIKKVMLMSFDYRFKAKLPDLCSLFRSKLFPDPGNSDTDSLGLSPPVSPKPASKRLKSSASTSASASVPSTKSSAKTKSKGREADLRTRERSNSLSLSLEQERRERSRSLSIGPNGLRKRAAVYEVTMTTKFGKARAKQKAAELAATAAGSTLSRTQSQQSAAGGVQDPVRGEKSSRSMGSVLVAATPSKPREALSRSQSHRSQGQSQSQSRLPSLFAGATAPRVQSQRSQAALGHVSLPLESDEDDGEDVIITPTKARRRPTISRVLKEDESEVDRDEWRLSGSPGTLPLGTSDSQLWSQQEDDGPPESSSPGDLGGFGDAMTPPQRAISQGSVMVEETPAKS